VIYVSPAFVVHQQGSSNNTFTLTPVIAKVFPGMTVVLNHNSTIGSDLARVEGVKMKFAILLCYFIVWMYCWANASFCCLKILVDKQDNVSIPIKNNPTDSVIVFALYNF